VPDYPWEPHFVGDLPSLAGLRLHWVDEGPRNSSRVYLCLHPIPGWSYHYRHWIAEWVAQGIRVLAPDLIGFGKSDKPKREDVHTLDFHYRYLIDWLERLGLKDVSLVVPQADHPLAQALITQAPDRIQRLLVQPVAPTQACESECRALRAPYPDAGHQAAERAFLSPRMRQVKMKL
jgi:tRNA(adenine34) deaminase